MFSTMVFIVDDIKHNNIKINDLTVRLHNTLALVSVLQCINTKVQTSMRTVIIAWIKDNFILHYLIPESLSSFI